MSINEFHAQFIARQERNRLFEILRQMSRLEKRIFLSSGTVGWAEWPTVAPRLELG